MNPQPYQAGWAAPARSKKWHYIWQGKSLCGRVTYAGKVYEMPAGAPHQCKECSRRHEEGGG